MHADMNSIRSICRISNIKGMFKIIVGLLLGLSEGVEAEEMVKEQLAGKELSIEAAYDRVATLEPYDPLEKRNMSVQEFESLVAW